MQRKHLFIVLAFVLTAALGVGFAAFVVISAVQEVARGGDLSVPAVLAKLERLLGDDDSETHAAEQPPVAGDTRSSVNGPVAQFHTAIIDGDMEQLEVLLERIDPSAVDRPHSTGMTPLMAAADAGQHEVVVWLLKRGADPNVRGHAMRTPLQYAVNKGFKRIAVALLDAGADVNAADNGNLAPLGMAANRNNPELALLLLERGADVNNAHANGFTAIIDAANHGRLRLVERLIEAGADVNARTRDGWSALHYAAARDYLAIAQALLEAGAEVDAKANNGETPMSFARGHGFDALVELLAHYEQQRVGRIVK